MSAPTRVGRIVDSFSGLKRLTLQAERLSALDKMLNERLPSALAAHVRLATIRDGCLVLLADSPVWATQLRHHTPAILSDLPEAPEFAGVKSIRIRNYLGTVERRQARKAASMGPGTALAMETQAESIPDPALRAALKRIARRGQGE